MLEIYFYTLDICAKIRAKGVNEGRGCCGENPAAHQLGKIYEGSCSQTNCHREVVWPPPPPPPPLWLDVDVDVGVVQHPSRAKSRKVAGRLGERSAGCPGSEWLRGRPRGGTCIGPMHRTMTQSTVSLV